MASAKPTVYVSPYATEVVASPYVVGATSSQYIARNYNGYSPYIAEAPIAYSSLPYTSYVI